MQESVGASNRSPEGEPEYVPAGQDAQEPGDVPPIPDTYWPLEQDTCEAVQKPAEDPPHSST